ncbi:MAG: hypothetical protein AAF996_18445 [Pseudomonadota bacterium]
MNLSLARSINLGLSGVGTLIFLLAFLYISLAPDDFDKRAQSFAVSQVEKSVDERLSAIANSDTADRISDLAGRVSDRLQSRVDEARDDLNAGMDEFISDVLAAACKLDCERRGEAAAAVRAFYESSILRHSMALERIQAFIEGQFDDVMEELRADLKIFAGSSGIALGFAFLLALFRGPAAVHLLPISITLSVATLLMAVWYGLGQDWVTTILYSEYWGWTYSVLLALLSSLMIDIAANRARVSSFVFNNIGRIFSSGFEISPC